MINPIGTTYGSIESSPSHNREIVIGSPINTNYAVYDALFFQTLTLETVKKFAACKKASFESGNTRLKYKQEFKDYFNACLENRLFTMEAGFEILDQVSTMAIQHNIKGVKEEIETLTLDILMSSQINQINERSAQMQSKINAHNLNSDRLMDKIKNACDHQSAVNAQNKVDLTILARERIDLRNERIDLRNEISTVKKRICIHLATITALGLLITAIIVLVAYCRKLP